MIEGLEFYGLLTGNNGAVKLTLLAMDSAETAPCHSVVRLQFDGFIVGFDGFEAPIGLASLIRATKFHNTSIKYVVIQMLI
jgi:hypothetical protein